MMPDYYQALGVQPGASREQIRAAYLRVVRDTHPDRRPDDPAATIRTQEANVAWEVLRDSARRASYDRLQHQERRDRAHHGLRLAGPLDNPTHSAYSRAGHTYRHAVHLALLRSGVAVVFLGCLVLLLLSR